MSAASCRASGCDAPVWIISRGLCKRHYGQWHYARSRGFASLTKPASGERYVIERIAFELDVPVAHSGEGLLGSVLRCLRCNEQFGPVRSPEAASLAITHHLRRDHQIDLSTALCARQNHGCRNLRHDVDNTTRRLCRACRRRAKRIARIAERLDERLAAARVFADELKRGQS